jgi:hypothetical protein
MDIPPEENLSDSFDIEMIESSLRKMTQEEPPFAEYFEESLTTMNLKGTDQENPVQTLPKRRGRPKLENKSYVFQDTELDRMFKNTMDTAEKILKKGRQLY